MESSGRRHTCTHAHAHARTHTRTHTHRNQLAFSITSTPAFWKENIEFIMAMYCPGTSEKGTAQRTRGRGGIEAFDESARLHLHAAMAKADDTIDAAPSDSRGGGGASGLGELCGEGGDGPLIRGYEGGGQERERGAEGEGGGDIRGLGGRGGGGGEGG